VSLLATTTMDRTQLLEELLEIGIALTSERDLYAEVGKSFCQSRYYIDKHQDGNDDNRDNDDSWINHRPANLSHKFLRALHL